MLKSVEMQAYLADLPRHAMASARVTAEKLVRGYDEQAFTDRTLILGEHGDILPPRQWPKELRHFISSVKLKWVDGYELVDDPARPGGKVSQKVSKKHWEVSFERSTDAKDKLAEMLRLIGRRARPRPENRPPAVRVVAAPHARPPVPTADSVAAEDVPALPAHAGKSA